MGFSTEQLIDIGLNFAGFLAAGMLTFYIYSLIVERRSGRLAGQGMAASSISEIESIVSKAATPATAPGRGSDSQFIRLTDNIRPDRPEGEFSNSQGEYRVRDRQEILNQARQMLAQKKRSTTVQKALPITEGELSFIKQSQKLQGKARMR